MINNYLFEFETLANRIIGFPSSIALSCFISGLNSAICREVQVLQLVSLSQEVAYARLQEEKQNDAWRTFRPSSVVGASSSSRPSLLPTPSTNPPLLPTPAQTASSSIPFKRLTPEELALWQEKGLWFQCDEKYLRGHKCSSSLFLLIVEDDDAALESNEQQPLLPELVSDPPPAQLSLNALSGQKPYQYYIDTS